VGAAGAEAAGAEAAGAAATGAGASGFGTVTESARGIGTGPIAGTPASTRGAGAGAAIGPEAIALWSHAPMSSSSSSDTVTKHVAPSHSPISISGELAGRASKYSTASRRSRGLLAKVCSNTGVPRALSRPRQTCTSPSPRRFDLLYFPARSMIGVAVIDMIASTFPRFKGSRWFWPGSRV